METNLTVILPILTLDEKEKDLFANAVKSIEDQKVSVDRLLIVVPKNSEAKKTLDSYDFTEEIKNITTVVENDGETDFCSQVNLGVENCETEWFSILELDDIYSAIWFDNFVEYREHYKEVDLFLPIVLDVNDENKFLHFSNEPVWARDFSEKMGYVDYDSLLNFPNFQLCGSVISTESFKSVGDRLFFNYEFLLRMSYYDMTMMTMPK